MSTNKHGIAFPTPKRMFLARMDRDGRTEEYRDRLRSEMQVSRTINEASRNVMKAMGYTGVKAERRAYVDHLLGRDHNPEKQKSNLVSNLRKHILELLKLEEREDKDRAEIAERQRRLMEIEREAAGRIADERAKQDEAVAEGKIPPATAKSTFKADVTWAYEQFENCVVDGRVDLTCATEPPPARSAIFLLRSTAKNPQKLIDLVYKLMGDLEPEEEDEGEEENPERVEDPGLETMAQMLERITGFKPKEGGK